MNTCTIEHKEEETITPAAPPNATVPADNKGAEAIKNDGNTKRTRKTIGHYSIGM
jgi:hypothetical protein